MEKYELLKDLPNAKAGEIFILSNGHLERQQEDSDGGHEILYDRYYVEKYGLLDPSKRWFRKVVKEAYWNYGFDSVERKFHLEIIFPTVKEARETFDKCNAWKRLKDAGFKFINWYGGSRTITYEFKDKPEGYIPVKEWADLDLLFGGEE